MTTFTYKSRYAEMMNINRVHHLKAEIDYKDLYLAFLNSHKYYLDDLGNDGNQLILITNEQVASIKRCPYWSDDKKSFMINKWCFTSYIDDTERMEWLAFEAQNIRNENLDVDNNSQKGVFFMTVGFSHCSNLTEQLSCIKNILKSNKVDTEQSYAVYERFRDDGQLHPHCHFKLFLHQYTRPSKVVEFVYAVKGVKKVCEKKNFIDVDKYVAIRHDKYLDGNKKDAKLADVERDRQYRLANNIPDKICG